MSRIQETPHSSICTVSKKKERKRCDFESENVVIAFKGQSWIRFNVQLAGEIHNLVSGTRTHSGRVVTYSVPMYLSANKAGVLIMGEIMKTATEPYISLYQRNNN